MNNDHPPLLGLAHLMRMAFDGHSLMPVFDALMTRAASDPQDANALMDLATVLQLRELKALGLATLRLALQVRQVYELPSRHAPRIRLLAIMMPGDLMANAPLPFLFEDSDIALTMLYLQPDQPTPMPLPEHDVAFIAISESSQARGLLERLATEVATWP